MSSAVLRFIERCTGERANKQPDVSDFEGGPLLPEYTFVDGTMHWNIRLILHKNIL